MRSALVVFAVVAALGVAGSASAARIHLVASPATVPPGAVVRISTASSPCHPTGQVILISAAFPGHAYGIGAVYGRVHAHGAFSVPVRIRSALSPGRYHVAVRCGGGNLPDLAYFRVT